MKEKILEIDSELDQTSGINRCCGILLQMDGLEICYNME